MERPGQTSSPVYGFFPTGVEGFDSLAELALDMNWYWNHDADEVWMQLEPELWRLTYNPWVVLQTVARDKLLGALSNSSFRRKVDDLLRSASREAECADLVSAKPRAGPDQRPLRISAWSSC